MKFLLKILVVFSILLISCGEDGSEGQAFLKFDWSYTVTGYDDSNPSIPSTIWKGQSYGTDKGTFFFSYIADNGTETRVWSGSYTITKNPGEKGGFLVDGKDGANKHFNLYLGWSGPSVSSYKSIHLQNLDEKETDSPLQNGKNPNISTHYKSELQESTLSDGNFSIKIRFQLND